MKGIKNNKKVKKTKEKKKVVNPIKRIFLINKKFNLISLVKNILIPLVGGSLIGFLTKSSISTYNLLRKPFFAPKNYIFPIVWIILYIIMGIAAYRIYMNNKQGKNDYNGYLYYLIQLSINFLWPIIFFNFRLYGISFILIILLLILVIITTVKFFKVDKLAGVLMIPYILWVSFASVLTFYIYIFNEM